MLKALVAPCCALVNIVCCSMSQTTVSRCKTMFAAVQSLEPPPGSEEDGVVDRIGSEQSR
jgi:hypothetical protein